MNPLHVAAAVGLFLAFGFVLTGFLDNRRERREWGNVIDLQRLRAASLGAHPSRRPVASSATRDRTPGVVTHEQTRLPSGSRSATGHRHHLRSPLASVTTGAEASGTARQNATAGPADPDPAA